MEGIIEGIRTKTQAYTNFFLLSILVFFYLYENILLWYLTLCHGHDKIMWKNCNIKEQNKIKIRETFP
jgi:hypothetical protein